MDKMKKRIYTISVNDKIYDAIEIHGIDTKDIASKIENLMKKFMCANYGDDLKIWERLDNFHYHTVDSKSGAHYYIKLNWVFLWTDKELAEYY